MNSISKLTILFALITIQNVVGQQDPNFTLYNFNMNIINPAYAGANDVREVTLSHRSQWMGVDNAPTTQSFSFSTPLIKNLGLGISIVNDKVFVLSETDITLDISYKLKVSNTTDLFFGIKSGGGFVAIDLNDTGAPKEDPLFASNQTFFNSHLGAGLYLKHKRYYVSFSTPNFLNGKRYQKTGNVPSSAVDNLHIYLGSGYTFLLKNGFEFTPALMLGHVDGLVMTYDLSSTLKMYEKYTIGANYRVDETISMYGLIDVVKQVKLGVAYDFAISEVKHVANANSLELILKYQF